MLGLKVRVSGQDKLRFALGSLKWACLTCRALSTVLGNCLPRQVGPSENCPAFRLSGFLLAVTIRITGVFLNGSVGINLQSSWWTNSPCSLKSSFHARS